ncbi:MAG: ferrous iron transport protein B [Chloroflexota bacterium]
MPDLKRVVLVGKPNSGKSSIFRILSDAYSEDFGSTYEADATIVSGCGVEFELIDLPGVYSLSPTQPSEKLAFDFLINEAYDLIVNVVDASLLHKSLELTHELAELGKPMVLAINMIDEAESHGISLDLTKLSGLICAPVVATQAIHGKGMLELAGKISAALLSPVPVVPHRNEFTNHLEVRINLIEKLIAPRLAAYNGSARFYAIKAIENPSALPAEITERVQSSLKLIEAEVKKYHKMDLFETVSYERHHLAMKLAESIESVKHTRRVPLAERIDDWLLHPIGGYVFLVLFFSLYFLAIFVLGNLISAAVEPPLSWLGESFSPLKEGSPFLWYSINGAYQGVLGAVGVVLPYFLPLVFLTALFEDTGYLARIAFLIDSLMHRIGLHGKSVVPLILGFGCSAPALYSTRMLESRGDRLITAMLIPMVPCSARISVIFALAAAFTGPVWAALIFLALLVLIGIIGKIISRIVKKPTGLILDIPQLRAPSLKRAAKRSRARIYQFLREATIFLALGGIALGWTDYFHLHKAIDYVLSPFMESVLGLPSALGSTLFFGFFRKELVLVMANQALGSPALEALPLLPEQIVVFVFFVTLYFPCLTTFVVLGKEFDWKTASLSGLVGLVSATIIAFILKLIFIIC